MTEHLSRHDLEQLVADDPHAPVHPALRVHLASCDQCSTRKRALEAARVNFLVAHPARDFARAVIERAAQPEPAPRQRWQGWSSPRVLATAAALLVLAAAAAVWFGRAPAPSAAISSKSSAALQIVASHAGKTSVLRDGATLAPGDQISFEHTLDRPLHLLLLGIDDAGAITRYFPGDPERAAPRPATPHAKLPIAILLDARKGEERLYAFFYDAALDEADARGAMIQALSTARAHGGIAAMRELDLPAHQFTVWFRKP